MNFYAIIDPDASKAAINLLVDNRMNSNISLEWQQQGKRQILLIEPNIRRNVDINFDPTYGTSPVVFRGYTTDGRRFPVKLNGALSRSFTPTFRRTVWLLKLERAVKNYFLMFTVNNLASGAIDVIWAEDGKQQTLTVPFRGKNGRAVLLENRLAVSPLTFEAFLKGTTERVTLNRENLLQVAPQAFITRRIFTAEKEYIVNVHVENKVAEDIEVRYRQSGIARSFIVSRGGQLANKLIFSGPSAKDAVQFDAISKQRRVSVKLNDKDIVTISPDIDKPIINLVARMKYFLVLKFENLVQDAVVVKWRSEDGEDKSTELKPNNYTIIELDFQGVSASNPLTLHAELKGHDKIVQLNGRDTLTVQPKPSKDAQVIRVSEKYYIDIAVKNEVAKGIVLVWNASTEQRTLDIAKGAKGTVEIVFNGARSTSSIDFQAFVEGTEVPVLLNGKDKISLKPTRWRGNVQINVSKDFFVDIEVKNKVGEAIELRWKRGENYNSQVIAPYDTSRVSIVTSGKYADRPMEFSAVLEGRKDPVELDEKSTLTLIPQMRRSPVSVTATAYKMVFINHARSNVVLKWGSGENSAGMIVPFRAAKERYLIFDESTDMLNFSGINGESKAPVLINGTKQFALFKDSRRLTTMVTIMDGKCTIFRFSLLFGMNSHGSSLAKFPHRL